MILKPEYTIHRNDYIALSDSFYDQDPQDLCKSLLGKVIFSRYENTWLKARIIETEAYYRLDKASHSYRGETPARKAMFMPPGTIYMYYARGKDSLNISSRGEGNAVLVKSAVPFFYDGDDEHTSGELMQELNPLNDLTKRPTHLLCAGQTLLCRSLNIKVKDWNQKSFDQDSLFIADLGMRVNGIINTTRVGISHGKDESLNLRFIDSEYMSIIRDKPR